MEQIQRDAAKSIGFTEETWNAQFSSSSATTKEEPSQKKMKEIGREEINKHNIFVKFYCTQDNTV